MGGEIKIPDNIVKSTIDLDDKNIDIDKTQKAIDKKKKEIE